ncbi:MAG: DUF5610 domain-containing protein [Cycloclasticus sp.]|nr:DUF5610 domain-containing protein [Cycloclasticus sp.]
MDASTLAPFGQQVQILAKSEDKKSDEPFGQTVSGLAHDKDVAKRQLNAAILESTISVTAADSPNALVLKAALEGINEVLSATLGAGDNAIQDAYDSGLDVSPEATAGRIVSLSTAFFSSYQVQHPGLEQGDALQSFTALIREGIDKGFSEARDILDGLSVLEGDIASNIDKTYDLVQLGLDSFLELYTEEA